MGGSRAGESAQVGAADGSNAGESAPSAGGGVLVPDDVEIIEVWAERKDKPFDRATELRLTQTDLIERGATNLAEALDLLPDVQVRAAGRGGLQVSLRGGRKGSIKILIDGVPISDPYYGTFDISAIPVTDIEQIRISPQGGSPIDGVGGPGGVIEVHTRDATGPRALRARFEGSSLPSSNVAATARSRLGRHWALRLSATATLGSQGFQVYDPAVDAVRELGEDRRDALGAARLEYRRDHRRLAVDSWAQTRHYVTPPGEDGNTDVLAIDGETMTRNSVQGDWRTGKWQLLGSAYAMTLHRRSTYYRDLGMSDARRRENLHANREGATVLAVRHIAPGRAIASAVLETEAADVVSGDSEASGRATTLELAGGVQLARGPLSLDAAAGVAVPMGIGATPWPEAKVTTTYVPVPMVRFRAVVGHKGRLPTLRERYEEGIGNQALGPEKVLFGDAIVDGLIGSWITTRIDAYVRRSNGQIRFDAMARNLINLGRLDTRGVEASIEVGGDHPVGVGAMWAFADAVAEDSGSDPLDFLPHSRSEAWIRGHLGSRAGGQVRVRYTGAQIDQADVIDAHTTVEASAYIRLGEITTTMRMTNIGDVSYPVRSGVMAPGRTVFLQLLADWK